MALEINKIYCGDNLTLMKQLDDNCIDLTVTSPPYDNLRTYNEYSWDFEGLARELFRVTKQGGVVVWVVGDATINGSETGTSFRQALYFMTCGFNLHDTMIYQKLNPLPLSSKNRYNQDFEYMFVLSKGNLCKKNIFQIPTKTPNKKYTVMRDNMTSNGGGGISTKNKEYITNPTKNRGNIWGYNSIVSTEYMGHPAQFSEKLAEDHIISWSNKGDLILDPFIGSGTTAKMALKNERNFIGFEISQEYVNIANERIKPWIEQTRLF